jgi:hypothetical protein
MTLRERFVYLPLAVGQVREEFESLYDEAELLDRLLDTSLIPGLLRGLAHAVAGGTLAAWMAARSRHELYLLVHAFPDVPIELRDPLLGAINDVYTPPMGRMAFRIWRRTPTEEAWPRLLHALWTPRSHESWGFPGSSSAASDVRSVLTEKDPVRALAVMARSRWPLNHALDEWCVAGAELGVRIAFAFFREATADDFETALGDQDAFRLWLIPQDGLFHAEVVATVDRYLTACPVERFDPKLLAALQSSWGSSDPPAEPWRALSAEALDKLAWWHKDHMLATYLDHERYHFWRRYLRHAERVHQLKYGLDVLIITFPDCVAVEFMQVGNAARVFTRKQFARTGWDRRAQGAQLTATDVSDFRMVPFIFRIVHSAAWQFDAEKNLRPLIGRPSTGPLRGLD